MIQSTLIPKNIEGKQNDLVATAELASEDDAIARFKEACLRMHTPALWHHLGELLSAEFALIDPSGHELHRQATTGDYIRIDIPGPGSRTGHGYDWVKVEVMEHKANGEDGEEMCGMRLRPAQHPKTESENAAHFFTDESTSTFIIQRRRTLVTATYHGRNERPNVNTESILDNVRNSIIASGAFSGISETHWKKLIKGFIGD